MKFNYLLVVLSNSSISFCYYNSASASSKKELISLDALKKTVVFALKNNLKVNFLFPEFLPDKNYLNLIEEVEHIKIVPFALHKHFEHSIIVFESDQIPNNAQLKKVKDGNFILRLKKDDLTNLYSITKQFVPFCKRLNLILTDIEKYNSKDYDEYQTQLKKISAYVLKLKTNIPELNFITDRIALSQMNNCNAGLNHLTVAPNGKLYICPAFYYENKEESLGEISNDIRVVNQKLLELENSPICRICDAYQCKRCVYLNKKTTVEINTPSAQQCILSHKERESSRILLNELFKNNPENNKFKVISELDYEDPFEYLKKNPQTSLIDKKNN